MVTRDTDFNGDHFDLDWLAKSNESVTSLNELNYAGNTPILADLDDSHIHPLVSGEIGDCGLVDQRQASRCLRATLDLPGFLIDRTVECTKKINHANFGGAFRSLEAIQRFWGELQSKGRWALFCACRHRRGVRFAGCGSSDFYCTALLESNNFYTTSGRLFVNDQCFARRLELLFDVVVS